MREVSHDEKRKKLIKGLEIAYKKMLEFKRMKNTELIIMKGNKIVRLKP